MFAPFMMHAWITATIVAVIAGVIGFFVVMRGSTFAAHAIPNGAFAGAAGAALIGVNTVLGLGVFSLLAALGLGWLSRRGRNDAVTALALVMMLALGALFLSQTSEYEPEIFSLLFGEVLGVASNEILPVACLGVVCISGALFMYRPLMFTAVIPEVAEANGLRIRHVEMAFLVLLALATAMTVPVVGALLLFSLMIGPPAAARFFTNRPWQAIVLSIGIALVVVWSSIAASYGSDWPIGFFVGTLSAVVYGLGRIWSAWRVGRGPDSGRGEARPTVGRLT